MSYLLVIQGSAVARRDVNTSTLKRKDKQCKQHSFNACCAERTSKISLAILRKCCLIIAPVGKIWKPIKKSEKKMHYACWQIILLTCRYIINVFVITFGPIILKTVSPLDPCSLIARQNPNVCRYNDDQAWLQYIRSTSIFIGIEATFSAQTQRQSLRTASAKKQYFNHSNFESYVYSWLLH